MSLPALKALIDLISCHNASLGEVNKLFELASFFYYLIWQYLHDDFAAFRWAETKTEEVNRLFDARYLGFLFAQNEPECCKFGFDLFLAAP